MAYINAPANTQRGVRTVHAGYNKAVLQWTRCRDVIAGGDAVKEKGEDYLPKLNKQVNNDYKSYKTRALFFNATGRTVEAMVGMLFRKPAKVEVPTALEDYLNNVTMCGDTFDNFVKEVTEENISVGRVGVLVDHPPMVDTQGKPLTVAMTQQLGLRPVMKIYTAENIINWRFKNINNNTVLCQVVLTEPFSEPVDEFGDKTEMRYRVLDLQNDSNTYRVRVFRISDVDGKDELVSETIPLMNGIPMTYIPFVFMCPDGTDADFDEPPILDLVDCNLAHYRVSADYEHGCHFTALPMLYVAGMSDTNTDGTPAEIYLGSQSALILSNSDAKAGFIEFTGQGLQTVENNLDRKEQMMAVLGARMLQPQKKAAETAMTSAIHRTGENSILASISIACSLGLEQCLKWFAEWAGLGNNNEINFEINRDFLPVAIDGPTLTAYMAAYQGGGLTGEELFDLFQRADLIEAEVTYEEHQAAIDAQQPAMPGSLGMPGLMTKVPANPALDKASLNKPK